MKKLAGNILSWCGTPESGAVTQAQNISRHPWLVGNVCLMPDTHEGYGMPIGGVVALDNAVCPNMVGVDIGCGMLAVKTSLTDITTEQLKSIVGGIKARIPVGFSHHAEDQADAIFDDERWQDTVVCLQEKDSARRQLGTLGGGNHFIEIQRGDDGHIWFMIHSGSRNLGYKVANHYNEIAKRACSLWKYDQIVKDDLAVLTRGEDFDRYWSEMSLCLGFAYANRQHMAHAIKEEFERVVKGCEFLQEINIHHNYAAWENHYGRNVIVHRKGATLARKDTIGIIPGSQGTCSYIVQGKGNPASMNSCSHGAGRRMSRKAAKENLDLASEIEALNERGILHAIKSVKDLEEAPSAYKDIDTVMQEQLDLVDILVKLKPLAVVKG